MSSPAVLTPQGHVSIATMPSSSLSSSVRFVQQQSTRSEMPANSRPRVVSVSLAASGSAVVRHATGRSDDARRRVRSASSAGPVQRARAGMASVLRSLFLPVGYPDSVTPDYLAFQSWDTAQAMCSYLRGILATQAILDGMGVGDGTKTVASATLQWVRHASHLATLVDAPTR